MRHRGTCSLTICERPANGRGLCGPHYRRANRTEAFRPLTAAERFWMRVDRRDPDDCWLWTGAHAGGGYGGLRVDYKLIRVHRFAYELLVGPIGEGLHIDHLCRVRLCVNPKHMEPVTQSENNRRQRRETGTWRPGR